MNSPQTRILSKIFALAMLVAVLIFPTASWSTSTAGRTVRSTFGSDLVTPSSSGVPGTNVPVVGEAGPDRQQVETTISVDPHNPNILVAGAQDMRLKSVGEHRWHGYYRSVDRGQTWTNGLLPGYPGDTSSEGLSSPLHRSNATSDPVLAFDRLGNVYYAGLVFNISATGPLGNGPIGNLVLFVAKYTNDGSIYSGATLISGALNADKPWIAADTTGGSNDGNVYVALDANLTTSSVFRTIFTRSTDGGKTFSPPFYVPSDFTGRLPGVAVDPAGNVYVSTDTVDPVTGAGLNYIQVSKITNGGTTLVQTVKAVNPAYWVTSGADIGASFRAYTIPQIAADSRGVYVTFDDMRLGNASVFLTRSTDGGSTWTPPLRINDALTGQHFFPTITAAGGLVDVAWYDSRLNTQSSFTSLDVFFAISYDGGVSFSANSRVTNQSFNPGLVNRTDAPNWNEPFMGDYVGIAATSSMAHPLWSDNRFACDTIDTSYGGCVDQDAFTAAITLPDFSISATPQSQTIIPGSSGSITATLTSLNGFQSTVTVSASSSPSGLPLTSSGATIQLAPGGTGLYNLTVSPTISTLPTTYEVNITPTTVVVQSSSVGGSIVSIDKLGLLAHLLSMVPVTLSILTAGALVVRVWRRHARRASASGPEGTL